jgi:hypothetical protein
MIDEPAAPIMVWRETTEPYHSGGAAVSDCV